MQQKTERRKQLCEQAAVEQDPQRLLELTREINDLFLGKQRRLERPPTEKATISIVLGRRKVFRVSDFYLTLSNSNFRRSILAVNSSSSLGLRFVFHMNLVAALSTV